MTPSNTKVAGPVMSMPASSSGHSISKSPPGKAIVARRSMRPRRIRMAAAAQAKGLDGWLISLEFPSYYAVMTYAHDRALREELYAAYCTRASDQGPNAGQFDNGPVMREILDLRQELAELLVGIARSDA